LTLNELAILLQELGSKITALPAVRYRHSIQFVFSLMNHFSVIQTAQVASQQGHYIGKKLNKLAERRETLVANDLPDMDEAISQPFWCVFCCHKCHTLCMVINQRSQLRSSRI